MVDFMLCEFHFDFKNISYWTSCDILRVTSLINELNKIFNMAHENIKLFHLYVTCLNAGNSSPVISWKVHILQLGNQQPRLSLRTFCSDGYMFYNFTVQYNSQ